MGSILSTNGSAIIAMTGDQCVSIAADKRFGIESETVSSNFQKVFEFGPHLYVASAGLVTDIQTMLELLRYRKNMYELKENRRISPQVASFILSNLLYGYRFDPLFVMPVVAGLTPNTFEPYVCSMDIIGCMSKPKDFVVSGTASEQLSGMCEAVWEPNLGPDELFETTAQALMSAFERDALSGYGAIVYVIEKDKVTIKHLKTRMD